jgi:hypothetical protein
MVKGELQQAVIEGGHHLASWAMARHHILAKEDRLGRKSASLWSSLMPSAWKSSFPDHRAFNSKSTNMTALSQSRLHPYAMKLYS